LKPSRINEAYFNGLIREYQVTWMDAYEYEERMRIHRNPEEYKENMIIVLNAYIEQIRARPELNYPGDTSTVPDLIDYVWKSDKRLRSLFNAMKHYSTLRNTKKIWVIMAHVAEYRAMINLVKRIKRSQVKMPARTREEYLHTTLNGSIDPAIINALLRSGPSLPALNTENLTIVNEDTYFRIIDYIVLLGKNLENYKDLHDKFNEERYRDYFLPFLNAVSPHYSAKGEVFNRLGKTDILVCDKQGNNLFIAECKIWKGEACLLNGVNQLLNTYVNWRDEKTAIIIFNRHVRQFSELVVTATEAMKHHPLFEHTTGQRSEASWSYLFRHPHDKNRLIRLELVLLNFV
jgi:hypothetical protein